MAKTQKEIMNALLGALEKGEGDLADLEALMDRVKKDIAEAKAEEKARKEKEAAEIKARGEKIAEMATRVLNDKATEADVALVMESYMHNLGIKDAKISAKDVQNAKEAADRATSALDVMLDALSDVFGTDSKPKAQSTKNADDVLNEFLKTLR
jgi:hypothetical protein